MSKITAEFSDNEIIIKKDMLRKSDDNINIIDIHDLILNKAYKSKIKVSNNRQANKIILMHEITNDAALEIDIKNAEKEGKNPEEIDDIKQEYADLINNGEMEKKGSCCLYQRSKNILLLWKVKRNI